MINIFVNFNFIKLVAVFIETLWISFSILDCIVYNIQGLHIYDRVVLSTIVNPDINNELNISMVSFFIFFLLIIFIGVVLFFLYKHLLKLTKLLSRKYIMAQLFFLISFTFIGYSYFFPYVLVRGEVLNVFPFLSVMRKRPSNEPMDLKYKFSEINDIKLKKRPNIIFILAESLRNKTFNSEVAPKLTAYFKKKECISPEYTNSGGHTTVYGVFSSLYGVWGYHFTDFFKQKKQSLGLDILKRNSYNMIAAVPGTSSFHSYFGSGFMFNLFDKYQEFISQDDVPTQDRLALDWGRNEVMKSTKPTFFFTFLYSTHANYTYPKEFERFTPVLPQKFNHILTSQNKKENFSKIYNRYKNSVGYLDSLIYDFFNSIPKVTLDNSIIIFTGDHGQEFGEEGSWGHAKTNYINAKIQVPLYICLPGFKPQDVSMASHVDIIPTLMDYLSNGEVSICSVDWDYSGVVGDIFSQSISEIWNEKSIRNIRKAHLNGKWDCPKVCDKCVVWVSVGSVWDCLNSKPEFI